MNLHKVQPRRPPPKLHSSSLYLPDVSESLLLLQATPDSSRRQQLIRQVIKLTYDSNPNQLYLCNILQVPCCPGPVAINALPAKMASRASELPALFRYLQKVKQYYACWLIFFDEELGILNVKLLTKFELEDFEEEISFQEFLVGIFIGKSSPEKPRTKSTLQYQKPHSKKLNSTGLSTKTTADSSFGHQTKGMKSISMKQKKPLKSHHQSLTNLYQKETGGFREEDIKKYVEGKMNPFVKKPKGP